MRDNDEPSEMCSQGRGGSYVWLVREMDFIQEGEGYSDGVCFSQNQYGPLVTHSE